MPKATGPCSPHTPRKHVHQATHSCVSKGKQDGRVSHSGPQHHTVSLSTVVSWGRQLVHFSRTLIQFMESPLKSPRMPSASCTSMSVLRCTPHSRTDLHQHPAGPSHGSLSPHALALPWPQRCTSNEVDSVDVPGRTMEEGATLAGGGPPACVCPYRLPSTVPDPIRPTVCIRRRTTSNGYVAAQSNRRRKGRSTRSINQTCWV